MKFQIGLIRTLKVHNKVPCVLYMRSYEPEQLDREGIEVTARFPFIKAVGGNIDMKDIRYILLENNIVFVAEQNTVTACDTKLLETRARGGEKGKKRAALFTNHSDRGAIAVIDTGITPHIDFMMPQIRLKAFLDLVAEKEYPYDDNGHGTFVAGTACANGISSGGKITGSAPEAFLVAIKAMDKNGEGGTLKLLEAMQWIMDNKDRYDIRVVCMSFGCSPVKGDPLAKGAEALVSAGLVVVCASGNSGEDKVLSPAISDAVISVGACDRLKNPAKFTSRGIVRGRKKPDFYAPGVSIDGLGCKKLCHKMSGTSVACPYVAGLCFRLKRQNPYLSPLEVRASLYKRASQKDELYFL